MNLKETVKLIVVKYWILIEQTRFGLMFKAFISIGFLFLVESLNSLFYNKVPFARSKKAYFAV